jgi:hypothetical protein
MTSDAISHWLLLTSLTGSHDIQQDSVQDNPVFGIALAADANDDDTGYAMPRDPNFCNIDVDHIYDRDHDDGSFTSNNASSLTATIIPFSSFRPIMDICKIITQNVHGLWCRPQNSDGSVIPNCERDMTKLEYLVYRMRCDDINAWLVQETWLEDDDFDTNIGGYHMFRTNSPVGDTGRNHLFRSVAIILSPRFYQAWKSAGSPKPITTDPSSTFAGRFIGILLKFDCRDHRRRKIKGKSLHICLVSAYHPCHDIPHDDFNGILTSLLHQLLQNAQIIIGADINAKLGRRDSDELRSVLGPHGPGRRNTLGTNLISVYLSHGLRIENTFFAAPSHYTLTNINGSDQTMIDIVAFSQQLQCRIQNCCITSDGVESDHTAVRLDITMTSLKHKTIPTLTRGTIDWRRIAADKATSRHYNEILLASTESMTEMAYDVFKELIIAAGTKAALLVKSTCDDWFQFSLDDLAPTIKERNKIILALRSTQHLPPSIVTTLCESLQRLSKHVKDKVIIAKWIFRHPLPIGCLTTKW